MLCDRIVVFETLSNIPFSCQQQLQNCLTKAWTLITMANIELVTFHILYFSLVWVNFTWKKKILAVCTYFFNKSWFSLYITTYIVISNNSYDFQLNRNLAYQSHVLLSVKSSKWSIIRMCWYLNLFYLSILKKLSENWE